MKKKKKKQTICKVYKCNDTYDTLLNLISFIVPYNKYNLLKYLFVLSYIFTIFFTLKTSISFFVETNNCDCLLFQTLFCSLSFWYDGK